MQTKKKLIALVIVSMIAAIALLAGCSSSSSSSSSSSASSSSSQASSSAQASGPIVIGCSFITANLNPVDSAWDLTAHGISEGVYMQDKSGNLVSRFVSDVTRKDDLTWEAKLTNKVKFSDGTDCDAQALADCLNYLQKNNEMTNGTAGVVTFTPKGTDTMEIVTTKPTPIMESLLGEWCNVVFKQDGSNFVYTGPYMVKKMESEVAIELEPNPYYDDKASKRSDVTLKVFNDSATMQQAFQSGEIDIMFGLTPEVAKTLASEGYTVKNFDAGYQYFAFTNLASGAMSDQNVRKAVNLLVDRDDMVKALDGGKVANGIFAHYYSFAGDVQEKTDEAQAASLLEAAGYAKNASGIYEKNGAPLQVKIITYSSRADLPILMQLASSELTKAGIQCTTEVVDDINTALKNGAYDIALYAQHTAPSGEPSAFLNMALAPGGSRNYAGYQSAAVDDLLAQMGTTEPGTARDKLSKDIQAIAAEDLPIIYLVDPEWHVALSSRVSNYEPYCGDYYVVNAQLGL